MMIRENKGNFQEIKKAFDITFKMSGNTIFLFNIFLIVLPSV